VREFLVRRIAGMAVTMLVVASVVFLVINVVPGSLGAVILGPEATDEEIARLDRQLGLDRPVLIRFAAWASQLARGDLGNSLLHGSPVGRELVNRLEPTILLALMATAVAIGVGLPLGTLAAVRHRTAFDVASLGVSLVGISIPSFWLGLNLILLFGLYLKLFPTAGYTNVAVDPWEALRYLVLPAFTLGLSNAALIARMSRANLLEVLRQDYVRTARSKGLAERAVLVRHAVRNAMVPTVSVIGVSVALMLGGAVVVESVFALPGVGRLMIESVQRRDFPMIQGLVLMIAAVVAMVNLLVDLVYTLLNPAIRYG
jgi:peptide/nickel transport system permease protein